MGTRREKPGVGLHVWNAKKNRRRKKPNTCGRCAAAREAEQIDPASYANEPSSSAPVRGVGRTQRRGVRRVAAPGSAPAEADAGRGVGAGTSGLAAQP